MALRDLINSYNPTTPLDAASTIPSSWYVDPEIAELERRTVFSRTWQVATRLDQLCKPGDYVTSVVAGEPVVIVRGNDDVIRGFFNVCRHHAAAVMTERCGSAKQLRCPYHGWTYALDGTLKTTPDLGAVRDFDCSSLGLVPITIASWYDWICISLAPPAPAPEHLPKLTFENLHWFERRHYRLGCNWKVFIDNYLDGGYHVPHLHKGLDKVLDYSQYQIELAERSCLQWSPLAGGGSALYYWVYPNFMINRYPDAMDTNLVIPVAVDETEVIFDFYFADVSERARERNLERIAVSEAIQNEDVAICESVQRGLSSRAYTSGRMSVHREGGEHLFHRLLYSDLSSGLCD